jgi:hypothetical protein
MWKKALGHVEVVVNEVAFRQPSLGEEDLFEIRDLDFAPTYSHRTSLAPAIHSNPLSGGQRPPEPGRMIRLPAPLT